MSGSKIQGFFEYLLIAAAILASWQGISLYNSCQKGLEGEEYVKNKSYLIGITVFSAIIALYFLLTIMDIKLATDFNIPIFASYQFNRKGAGDMANIGGSDSVGQLASIVLSLTSEDKDGSQQPWSKRSFKHLQLIKGREGEEGKIRVLFDMRRMIIQQDSILEGVYDEESPRSAIP